MRKDNKFLWASFLPALAYWYLEANYDLRIALAGGLILAIVEMSLEWIFTKHIHTISKLNFYLILILGGIAFIANEGIWFKLQPAFTGVIMGSYMLIRLKRNDSLMIQMMKEMNNQNISEPMILFLEKNLSMFMLCYGFLMVPVAMYLSTEQWLFFKTGGFYIITCLFFLAQFFYLKLKSRKQ